MTFRRPILFTLGLLVLIVALPLLALLGFNIRTEYQNERALAVQQLELLRQNTTHQLSTYLRELRALLSYVASQGEFHGTDQAAMIEVLRQAKAPRVDLTNLAFLDQAGHVVATVFYPPQDPNTSLRPIPAYAECLDAEGFHISTPFQGTITKRWSCAVGFPVRDREGRRVGTVIAPLNLIELSARLFPTRSDPDTIISVVSANGTMMMRSYEVERHIGTPTDQAKTALSALKAGQSTGTMVGRDQRERIYSIGALPETDWVVAATMPRDLIFASADVNLRRSVALLCVLLVALTLVCYGVARSISRPITALATAARDQSAGNSCAFAPVSGPAEIADTALAFNEMAGRRQQAEQGLRRQTDFLESLHGATLDLLHRRSRSTLLQGIVDRAALSLSAPLAELLLIEGDTLVVAAYTENQPFLAGDRIPRAPERLAWQAVESGKPVALADYSSYAHRREIYTAVPVRAVADFPIISGGKCLGVLALGRIEPDRVFTPEEIHKGEIFCALAAVILEHAASAEALRESEDRYSTVIDQTGQMIYDLDIASGANRWFGSEATPAITGYSLAEFQRIDFAEWEKMIHPDDRPKAMALFDAALKAAEPYHVEYRFRHKDGTYRLLEDHGVFICDHAGKPYRMLGRMSDITARRHAEESRAQIERKLLETQKLESLGVLAGGIAHDFNNLLTGILGNASLARLELPAGSTEARAVAQIETAAHRAADLCKQMLAYSGKGRFVVQRVDLSELVRDTVQLLRVSISKSAHLHIKLVESLPPVMADATQLRQVVMNLVINASEALGERPGEITLHTGVLDADAAYFASAQVAENLPAGRYVFLEVVDTGTGMDRETLARIFDPFFTTKFTGRGLGLAAVQGIIRGHRGAVRVYSEPGRGTTFKILFPAAEGAAEPSRVDSAHPLPEKGEGHILIIDDESTVRETSTAILRAYGFTAESAVDGRHGLEIFKASQTPISAVLLDLTMPNMDGEETFRQLRQLNPGVKVVLMSGFNKVDAINRFTGKGLAGFVQKPFDFETLLRELRRVLET